MLLPVPSKFETFLIILIVFTKCFFIFLNCDSCKIDEVKHIFVSFEWNEGWNLVFFS